MTTDNNDTETKLVDSPTLPQDIVISCRQGQCGATIAASEATVGVMLEHHAALHDDDEAVTFLVTVGCLDCAMNPGLCDEHDA